MNNTTIDLDKINQMLEENGFEAKLTNNVDNSVEKMFEDFIKNTSRYEKEISSIKKNNDSLIIGNQYLIETNQELTRNNSTHVESIRIIAEELKRANALFSNTRDAAQELARGYMALNSNLKETPLITREISLKLDTIVKTLIETICPDKEGKMIDSSFEFDNLVKYIKKSNDNTDKLIDDVEQTQCTLNSIQRAL